MKKLLSIFEGLEILKPTNRIVIKDTLGDTVTPVPAKINPSFRTVLPNGVTQWIGQQNADFKAWCKKMNVSATYTRFDQTGKPKIKLECYLRGQDF